jgi:hypothetical protein
MLDDRKIEEFSWGREGREDGWHSENSSIANTTSTPSPTESHIAFTMYRKDRQDTSIHILL